MDGLKRFIFKTKILFRPGVRWWVRGMLDGEHLLPEVATVRQKALLAKLVAYVFQNNPFYRKRYTDVGFELGDMEQEGWFEKLPVVTKAHLKEYFEEMTEPELKRFRKISTTGGSTGTPTKTGYDGRIPEMVYSWRLQSWFGIHPWDDHAYVWRIPKASCSARLKNAALWWPTRHLKLDASFMTEASMMDFLRRYNRLKPALLQGYVGAVTQLAQFVVECGLQVWSPKCVWVTSAPLSAVQRVLLKEAFHAPVCDQYGSCEVRWIAQQCPEEGGLHVNTEHVHIEFVDDWNLPVKRGQYGKVLLTNLEDRVFPLIRYENGDRGRWLTHVCPCGRTLPLIDAIKGRESESFVLPSGMTVNGEYLTTLFDNNPDLVRGFRVVQKRDSSIRVEYIPARADAEAKAILSRIQSNLETRLNHEVPVIFEVVEVIAHDRGKLRFVVRER